MAVQRRLPRAAEAVAPSLASVPAGPCPAALPPILLGGTVNLLAGAPGVGKTAFLAWWIRQFHDGGRVFDQAIPARPPVQAWITADRSWDHSTRLWFAQVGLPDLPHYSLQDDRSFKKSRLRNKRDRIAILKECLAGASPGGAGHYPPGSLIYVDPLALFLGGNLIDYDTCAVACSEVREICLDQGLTIIGTAHSSKQKAEKRDRYLRLQDRILGSTALFGYTDTQMFLASPDELDVDHYTFLWAPHHARTQTFKLARDERGLFLAGDEVVQPTPGRPPVDARWLELAMYARVEPWTFADVQLAADKASVSRATATRHLREAVEAGKVRQVRRGLYQWVKPS